jgi:Domain of unknown function (DUF4398)
MGRAWVIALLLLGCGPTEYIGQVTRRASDRLEAARVAEADKYAPYYWTRAKEYLYKARERAAYADFQGANRFGRLASEAAELAEQMAIAAKKDPKKRPLELLPDVAPAKTDEPQVAPAKDQP